MNNPKKVYDFLKTNPDRRFCDDCVEKGSGVDRHEVNTIAWRLALFPREFSRKSVVCSQRNRKKAATLAVRNSKY